MGNCDSEKARNGGEQPKLRRHHDTKKKQLEEGAGGVGVSLTGTKPFIQWPTLANGVGELA